jgi:hypothetical protein
MQHQEVLVQANAIMDKASLDLASARRLVMLEFREQMSARWVQDAPPTTSERCLPPRQPSRRSSGVRSASVPFFDHHSFVEREWSAHECPSSKLRMPRRSLDDATTAAEQQPPHPTARMPAAA